MSPYFVEKKSVKYSDYFEKKKKKRIQITYFSYRERV